MEKIHRFSVSNYVTDISNMLQEARKLQLRLENLLSENTLSIKYFPNNYKQTNELFQLNSREIEIVSNELITSLSLNTLHTKNNISFFSALSKSCPETTASDNNKRSAFKRRRLQTDVSFLSPKKYPQTFKKDKLCKVSDCTTKAIGKLGLCKKHGGGRRCKIIGCNKASQGKNGKCVAHGGGKRCSHPGCSKLARGKTNLCIPHGGGNRCIVTDCKKLAQGGTQKCIKHGGGKRCRFIESVFSPGFDIPRTIFCQKSAVANTNYCVAHGGGKRCQHNGCKKGAVGKTDYCVRHGGGKRCTHPGCTKSAVGKSNKCISCGGKR